MKNYLITSLDSHILDFAELKFFRSNITTLRIMDPLSVEVVTAVHDWQQDARRKNDYSGIYADRIKTEAALFNDAVRVFSIAFREANAHREANGISGIELVSLRCADYKNSERNHYGNAYEDESDSVHAVSNKWEHGMQILQTLDQVPLSRIIIIVKIIILIFTKIFKLEN